MLFREQPNRPWTDMDFKWLEAYQIMKDEICPQCGNPIWLCRSTDDRISWHEETSVCYATRAKEEKEYRRSSGKKKKLSAEDRQKMGRISFMIPQLSEYHKGEKLPTREEYYLGR